MDFDPTGFLFFRDDWQPCPRDFFNVFDQFVGSKLFQLIRFPWQNYGFTHRTSLNQLNGFCIAFSALDPHRQKAYPQQNGCKDSFGKVVHGDQAAVF